LAEVLTDKVRNQTMLCFPNSAI